MNRKFTFTVNVRKLIAVAAILATGAVGLTACSSSSKAKADPQAQSAAQTVQAYNQFTTNLDNQYPVKQLTFSTELANLKERLLRYNNPSKISYIYLLSNTGAVLAYYTIKGKVTANASQMTTTQLKESYCHYGNACNDILVDAPEDDGSYGANEPGIFFFTTDNVMITWDGPYLMADAPQKIDKASVTIQYVDGSNPTSTGGVTK